MVCWFDEATISCITGLFLWNIMTGQRLFTIIRVQHHEHTISTNPKGDVSEKVARTHNSPQTDKK